MEKWIKIANTTFLIIPNAIEYFTSIFLSITLKYENATKIQNLHIIEAHPTFCNAKKCPQAYHNFPSC